MTNANILLKSGIAVSLMLLLGSFSNQTKTTMHTPQLYPEVKMYLEKALELSADIDTERKEDLDALAAFIKNRPFAQLTFICTHNSRRSHMGQIWAAAAASFFHLNHSVQTFSGGTEETAFNTRAVAALQRVGLRIDVLKESENPVYNVRFAMNEMPMRCFSKVYSHPFNPKEGFAAVMTCSQADEACPIVAGAAARFSIPYDDPKKADGTNEEAQRYDERSLQIASEMMYVMQQASKP